MVNDGTAQRGSSCGKHSLGPSAPPQRASSERRRVLTAMWAGQMEKAQKQVRGLRERKICRSKVNQESIGEPQGQDPIENRTFFAFHKSCRDPV